MEPPMRNSANQGQPLIYSEATEEIGGCPQFDTVRRTASASLSGGAATEERLRVCTAGRRTWLLGASALIVVLFPPIGWGAGQRPIRERAPEWRLAGWQDKTEEWFFVLVPEDGCARPCGTEEQYVSAAVKEREALLRQLEQLPSGTRIIYDPHGLTQIGSLVMKPIPSDLVSEIEEMTRRLGLNFVQIHVDF